MRTANDTNHVRTYNEPIPRSTMSRQSSAETKKAHKMQQKTILRAIIGPGQARMDVPKYCFFATSCLPFIGGKYFS